MLGSQNGCVMAADRADGESADAVRPSRSDIEPIALVGMIAESLPGLDAGELNALADAVEALTDAIGLRLDWSSSQPDAE